MVSKKSKNGTDVQTVLQAKVTSFSSELLEGSYHWKIKDIRRMLILDETTSLAYESLCLLITSMIGEYHHDNQVIKDDVNKQLSSMKGTIKQKWLDACTIFPYGFVFAELKHDVINGKATITDINFLRQDLTEFDSNVPTEKVTFNGDKTVELEYRLGFHLINQSNISPGYNPLGHRLGDRALRYWELNNILLSSYAIVAQKQATKLIVGKTDTTADVTIGKDEQTDEDITKASSEVMLEALEGTVNSSVLVIDNNDSVEIVDQAHDGEFFLSGFHHCSEMRFRAFYHPNTTFANSKSGVGDAGLAESQQKNLLMIAASKSEYLTEEFVEQIIKPIIIFNYGEQENYGSFRINVQDPKALEAAKIIGDLIDKFNDENDKKVATEKLKELLGMG